MSSYISTDDLAALNLTTPSAMAAPSTLSKPSGAAPLLAAKEGRRSSTGTNERAEHRSEHTSNSPAPSYFNCAPSYDQDEQASKLNAGMTTEGAERRSIATDSSSSCWATSFMSSRSSGKRVMFCPLALLIQTAADGEKDPAVVHGQKTEKLSRPRITVKTYSVDTPNISTATSRAWKNVCAGFSSSLKPLLSPNAPSGSGSVCSTSPHRRASSPERDHDRTSFARSKAYDEETDPRFTPNPRSTGMRIKLPTLATRAPPSQALCSPTGRSILKTCSFPPAQGPDSPEQGYSEQGYFKPMNVAATAPPIPMRSPESFPSLSPLSDWHVDAVELTPRSIASYSSSPPKQPVTVPQPLLATSPRISSNPAQSNIGVVPVSPCCRKCGMATDYGLNPDEHYEERWTVGARRKRARDKEETRDQQAVANSVRGSVTLDHDDHVLCGIRAGSSDEKEEEEEEEAMPPLAQGFGRVVVDELQGRATRTHSVTDADSDEASGQGLRHIQEEVSLQGTEEQQDDDTSTVSSDDDLADELTSTPATSPDMSQSGQADPLDALIAAEVAQQQAAEGKPGDTLISKQSAGTRLEPASASSPSTTTSGKAGEPAPPPTRRRFSVSKVGKSVFGAGAGLVAGMGGGGRGVWT